MDIAIGAVSKPARVDSIENEQNPIDPRLVNLDRNLKLAFDLYWRSKKNMQGFNIGLVDQQLTAEQRLQITAIVKKVDEFNIKLLETESQIIPPLRLNRLDFMVAESGDIYLLEQNPGWIDNIGFASVLSEDFSLVLNLIAKLREVGITKIIMVYGSVTEWGLYEQQATANLLQILGIDVEIKNLVDITTSENNVFYLLNTPLSKLEGSEKEKALALMQNSSDLVSPTIGLSSLDNKTILTNELAVPEFIPVPNNLEDLCRNIIAGYRIIKPTASASSKGVLVVPEDITEEGLIELFNSLSSDEQYIMQKKVEPVKVSKGQGLDYNRAKGNPRVPEQVALDGRPIKFNVWCINGETPIILGCVSRSESLIISDAGFNFKV